MTTQNLPEPPCGLAAARARVQSVTDWIAAQNASSQLSPAAVSAAVAILAAHPADRDVWPRVLPASVYRVGGHLVAVYHSGSLAGPLTGVECSCPVKVLCEHVLVAVAYELPDGSARSAG